MDTMLSFDYFYEEESEQFSFYRVPKMLITDPRFSGLSTDAKLLYGMMLDRMALSRRNQWVDEQGRVYIVFTVEEVTECLNCGRDKGIKVLSELDDEKGIGLIRKVRQGLGRPTIIYVMNFVMQRDRNELPYFESEKPTSGSRKSRLQGVGKTDFKESEKPTSRSLENRLQGVGKTEVKKSGKPTSRSLENRSQEVWKTDANKNNYSQTEMSNTESIYPSEGDAMDWESIVKDNIGYDILCIDHPGKKDLVDELVDIMVETLVIRREQIRVGDAFYPYDFVKSKLLRLDRTHIQYILHSLSENTTRVRNMKSYLLSCLINAPSTISNFYSSLVQHDMYHGA